MVVDKPSKKIICAHLGKGKKHDYRLFKESRLSILSSTEIQAESCYQGIQTKYCNSNIPHKGKNKCPLTKMQKKENHLLSSSRVVVENVLRTLKIFRIVAEKYRNRRKRFGLRLNLITGIVNNQAK
ncbi:MAG: transposase family protein [Phycisphaerales bacterium]|nr:transposase family protein [Phycisphaerales bacterium]